MKIDFHCHTNCSDGVVPPKELIDLALENGVDVLAITDHDTLGAYDQLPLGLHVSDTRALANAPEGESASLRLISCCEFSALWNGQVIHIVGLNFDLQSAAIHALLEQNLRSREDRAKRIGAALEKDFPDVDVATEFGVMLHRWLDDEIISIAPQNVDVDARLSVQ